MNNKPKVLTRCVDVLFEESFYDELKEYADKHNKPVSTFIREAIEHLVRNDFNKATSNEIFLSNRLNALEEVVIELKKDVQELEKQIDGIINYVYHAER